MKLKKYLISIIFLIGIGVILIVLGIVAMTQGNALKKRCTQKTTGTVVEIVSIVHPDDTSPTYFPVIEYQAGDSTISQMSNSGQYPSKYREGDRVEIYYNPNNVQEFIIKGDSTPNFVGIFCIVFGSIAAVVGVIGSIISARRTQQQNFSEII